MNANKELSEYLVGLGFRMMQMPDLLPQWVFGKIYYVNGHRLSLRIYVGLDDKIKLCMFFMTKDGPVPVGRTMKCVRDQQEINSAIAYLSSEENIPLCNKCKSPMCMSNDNKHWYCAKSLSDNCDGSKKTNLKDILGKKPKKSKPNKVEEIAPWEEDDKVPWS